MRDSTTEVQPNYRNRSPQIRIGVFGGTFDPIHYGHLAAANEVYHRLKLEKILFVPSGEPWQKSDQPVTNAELRCEMVQLAIASNPAFELSRVDVDRAGPSYTVDTLRDLQARLEPGTELYFIAGADTIANIPTWHDVQALGGLADFVAFTRPGVLLDYSTLQQLPIEATQLDIPGVAISSTQCRERVQMGLPLQYLVPDEVIEVIAKCDLYKGEI